MTELLLVSQIIFVAIMAMYLYVTTRNHKDKRDALESSSRYQSEQLNKMRRISLSEPLSEKTRPTSMSQVIGQEEGIRALEAALCGKNPQHVLIYGPPGVGKTCAARLALEVAKKSKGTPFAMDAKFIEMDATCIRFDERAIADCLIGSVHDPIYQGAGAYGPAGVPQPKPGAVTKAHGGVLFLDEIGELHPIQMNKLLKVMEDRRVFFESAYYSREDKNIPGYVHDIFTNGMPADFRLIGATTRMPEEIPAAIRSRCIEVFFRPLYEDELAYIATNAAKSGGIPIEPCAAELIAHYSANGRDTVNIVQLALGMCFAQEKQLIEKQDVQWILQTGQYHERPELHLRGESRIGCVNGLVVSYANQGIVFELEAVATPVQKGTGTLSISGFAEREEMTGGGRKLSRKSTAMGSVQNVLTVLKKYFELQTSDYDLHINASGGLMVDGPSAGIAIALCIYSAITGTPIPGDLAFTGELTLTGKVKPVGGVRAKVEAALRAGACKVYVPVANAADATMFGEKVVAIDTVFKLFEEIVGRGTTIYQTLAETAQAQ